MSNIVVLSCKRYLKRIQFLATIKLSFLFLFLEAIQKLLLFFRAAVRRQVRQFVQGQVQRNQASRRRVQVERCLWRHGHSFLRFSADGKGFYFFFWKWLKNKLVFFHKQEPAGENKESVRGLWIVKKKCKSLFYF